MLRLLRGVPGDWDVRAGDRRRHPGRGSSRWALCCWVMDALRLRSDAVVGGSRSAMKRGVGGAAEAQWGASALNPPGSSRGSGHEATELRHSQSGQVSVPGLASRSASARVGSAFLNHLDQASGEQTSSPTWFALRRSAWCPLVSPDSGRADLIPIVPVSDQGRILQRFLAGNAGQSLKPLPVVRPFSGGEHGARVSVASVTRPAPARLGLRPIAESGRPYECSRGCGSRCKPGVRGSAC